MKIRTDFVTNSSSVSYIITMDPKVVEKFNKLDNEGEAEKKKVILSTLVQDITANGTPLELDGREVYLRKYQIRPKSDTLFDTAFDEPEAVDFAALSEKELWKYIYGEYFVNLRIDSEYKGFSCLLLPHEMPETRNVMIIMSDYVVQLIKKNHFDTMSPLHQRVFTALYDDISAGTACEVEESKLFMKKYHYHIKNDCLFDDSFGIPVENVDFTQLSHEDLWKYIRGEWFLNGRLKSELRGFALLPVGGKSQ
ncbi:MAG: hypothetical protein K0R57_2752 [Paenibacillaceae bacterium]|jgi:hypothetical protein|nr:hypothetical protein [Paenibacillaceae bacterium]